MKNIEQAPFIEELKETTANMYRLGWDERNGGNISVRLDEALLREYREYVDPAHPLRSFSLGFDASELAGKYFLATGTGKYFKNVSKAPAENLGILRVGADGRTAKLLWGLTDGGAFTSELPAHLMSHIVRQKVDENHRVIMHCHPTYTVAMSGVVQPLEEAAFTKAIWKACSECVFVFPDGIGVVPWMVCGNEQIGQATAAKMQEFRLVLWALHGIYAAGKSLDDCFGLIETVEKAAQLYMLSAPFPGYTPISDDGIRELANFFCGGKFRADFL